MNKTNHSISQQPQYYGTTLKEYTINIFEWSCIVIPGEELGHMGQIRPIIGQSHYSVINLYNHK